MNDPDPNSLNFQKLIATQEAIDLCVIMSVTDKNGIIKSANKKFCEISQYEERELVGKTHRVVNSSHHSEEFFKTMWATIKSGKPWMGEIKNKAKDGTYYWVETVIVPVLSKGEIEEFISLRILITDRKNSEEKHLASEERYRTLVENLPDKIALSKADGRIIYANANYSNFFSAKREDLSGEQNRLFVPEEKRDEFYEQLKNLTPENPYLNNVFISQNPQNELRYILWKEVGIFNAKGNLSELLSVGRDITQMKRDEAEIKKSYKELQLIDSINKVSLENISYTELLRKIFDVFDNYTVNNRNRLYLYEKESNSLKVLFDEVASEVKKVGGLDWEHKSPKIIAGGFFDKALRENNVIVINKKEAISAALSQSIAPDMAANFTKMIDLLNINSIAIIPLVAKGEVHAIITLASETEIPGDVKGTLQRLCLQFSAILSRVKAENEIINQKKFTESILNNLPADIAVFDDKHKYIFVNKQAIADDQIRNWIIGKDDFEYFRLKGKGLEVAEERKRNFDRSVKKQNVEWVDLVKKEGKKKYILRKFYPYFENGKLKYVFGYGTDITSLKLAEKMKDEYIVQLERMAFSTSHQLRHSLVKIVGLSNLIDLKEMTQDDLKRVMAHLKPSLTELDNFIREMAVNIHEFKNKISKEEKGS
jgi:PAS domain S-box-containing protein